jgi:predicted small secreted protein
MKWGRFVAGIAAGLAVGYVFSKSQQPSQVKPEKVIQMVKNRYKSKTTITGSWIHVEPQRETINGIEYDVYQGGFTGVKNGYPEFYEFKVDAHTGTLLMIDPN